MINSIIGLIIGCVLVICGLYFMFTDSDQYLKMKGIIIDIPEHNSENSIVVSYKINNVVYTQKLFIKSFIKSSYVKEQPINMRVSKQDYNNAQIDGLDRSVVGSSLLVSSVLLIGSIYLYSLFK